MSDNGIPSYMLHSDSERDRERKRMDRVITIRALLIEAGAVGLLLYLAWVVLLLSSHGTT